MDKQFAVLHIEKGKGSGGGLGNHIDRKKNILNADQEKEKFNMHGIFDPFQKKVVGISSKKPTIPLNKRVEMRIKEGYQGKRGIRSDAVRFLNIVLTGSHNQMKEIEKDPEELKRWIRENYSFVCSEFGMDNVVSFAVHRDERTPHIHATVVPLTEDGRLSAKEIMGNRTAMGERQTRYADVMLKFGLKRGLKGSRAKHESVREFYGRLNEAEKILKQPKEEYQFSQEANKLLNVFLEEKKHQNRRKNAQEQKGNIRKRKGPYLP